MAADCFFVLTRCSAHHHYSSVSYLCGCESGSSMSLLCVDGTPRRFSGKLKIPLPSLVHPQAFQPFAVSPDHSLKRHGLRTVPTFANEQHLGAPAARPTCTCTRHASPTPASTSHGHCTRSRMDLHTAGIPNSTAHLLAEVARALRNMQGRNNPACIYLAGHIRTILSTFKRTMASGALPQTDLFEFYAVRIFKILTGLLRSTFQVCMLTALRG